MRTRQLIVVTEDNLRSNEFREPVSLFGSDGKPINLEERSAGSTSDQSSDVSSLKGRITKLEKRVQELEEQQE